LKRCLTVDALAQITISFASQLGLAWRVETLRRIAGIREPVPAGSVFDFELTIGQETDSAYGFWKTYTATAEGSAREIVDGIAAALSPAEAARAVLEASTLGSVASFEGTMTPPPLPEGGVLGAKEGWETWTIYKTRSRSDVAAEYTKRLSDDGWRIIGFCDVPGDARVQAERNGIQVEGTFYDEGASACVSADAEPWLFPALVEALYRKHGKAFASAFAEALRPLATDESARRRYGNLGYHLSVAAIMISELSGEPPDPICDSFVARHQAGLNVLIAPHMKYLSLVPLERRSPMICTIVGAEGSFLELAQLHPTPEVLAAAAAQGLRSELSSYRSGYDDERRIELARRWAFVGDRAVDTIQKAFKADKVGNPDIAATMLIEIGTSKARLALGKLAKHPDKKVQKLVQAALSSSASDVN